MRDRIIELSRKYFKEIQEIRRHLHAHPELSFEEFETSKYIKGILSRHGIAYTTGWVKTGIVGIIKGELSPSKGEEKIIALRADMDALPIKEANTCTYKSRNEGVMHACGHDVHTASLLGAAIILNEIRNQFSGVIKLIFQPGEEKLPGGANLMIEQGVLNDPSPSIMYGQHVHPPLETGKVGIRPGKYMASADEIYISVKGVGGHAALPHECIDPILITSHLIVSLQQVVSRNSNPLSPTVLSFGKIESMGGATNIIPAEVKIQGTFRALDEQWRSKAHTLIVHHAENLAKSMGGSCDVNIIKGYPYLENNEELSITTKERMIDYLGPENVVDLPQRMSAEDFAFYSQKIPSCFYRLGTGNQAKGITSAVHTTTFDIDEESLKIGAGLLAYLTFRELSE